MRRSDFARHDRVMNGLIVDDDGLDVLYWRKLTSGEATTKPGRVKKTGIRFPVAITSSHSSSSLSSSSGRNFEKYSRRTRRSGLGSVEITADEIGEVISAPEVISLIRGDSSSSSSNEEPSENRDFSPPSLPPRESPHVLPPSTSVELPAALAGQNQARKVNALTNSNSGARRLLRPLPARELPRESTAQPPREAPLRLQERSAGQNQASRITVLTNSRSRPLHSPRVREPSPHEEPQVPASPLLQRRAASLTGQTQRKVSVTDSNGPLYPIWLLAATDSPKESTAPPQENIATSFPIQSRPEMIGPPNTPLPPQMTSAPPPPPPPNTLTSSKAPAPATAPLLPRRLSKAADSASVQSQPEKVGPPKTPLPPQMKSTPPPPPPPKPLTGSKAPPPPPLLPRRPAKAGDSASGSKPPPPPLRPAKKDAKAGEKPPLPSGGGSSQPGLAGAVADDQVKLKPLHWEKVNVDTEHSMVWNQIDRGSFRVDGDLMEALFGSGAMNQKPVVEAKTNRPKQDPSSTKIFILEIRKSQNIAIILRSLGVSHSEILQSLEEGHGLMAETLERLNQIVLTKDEQSKILRFDGDVSRLADAESFLFKVLKAFPSAFTRFQAMLFKLTFDSEIAHLRESMKVMEAGCNELREGGIFVKLLEAILKAGNRMNAGTVRGDAAAFNLNSLKKLADVKSVDGKTTLLHFVVEEVVRSEGKRRVLNRAQNTDQSKDDREKANSEKSKEEKESEFTALGLSVVGALSVEFSNVKKAAAIDSKSLSASASSLSSRLIGYQKEMTGFITGAEKELESVRKTQMETLDLVKKTTEYYGLKDGSGINPLQIFVVVKDFLAMVDKVCAEIARNLQRKKVIPRPTTAVATTTESSTPVAAAIPSAKFINLPAHFMSGNSTSDDSDTEF